MTCKVVCLKNRSKIIINHLASHRPTTKLLIVYRYGGTIQIFPIRRTVNNRRRTRQSKMVSAFGSKHSEDRCNKNDLHPSSDRFFHLDLTFLIYAPSHHSFRSRFAFSTLRDRLWIVVISSHHRLTEAGWWENIPDKVLNIRLPIKLTVGRRHLLARTGFNGYEFVTYVAYWLVWNEFGLVLTTQDSPG